MPEKPIKRHIQGDLRPFGAGGPKPVALVRMAEIKPLVESLELECCDQLILGRAIQKAIGAYLGEQAVARKKLDHAASRSALNRIAKTSAKLAADLQALHPDILALIDEHRAVGDRRGKMPTFEFLHLIPKLRRLRSAAGLASDATKSRRRGVPPKESLDRTIASLSSAIQSAKLKIVRPHSGSAEVRKRVEGKGGELLVRIFEAFDPAVGVAEIHGALGRISHDDV